MALTPEQIKGKIKSLALKNETDPRVLLRLYAMERFLERLSISKYKENFILKGGMLVTAMIGISLRSTMDIDTSIRNQNLSASDVKLIIEEINKIDIDDDIIFHITTISDIMDEMEYPGIRVAMIATIGNMSIPLKIDISTGDAITPKAIEYQYKLILENRSINLYSYNLETVLAEKLQTILARGLLNTRMRDFYDVYMLLKLYKNSIDFSILQQAFAATCHKRNTLNILINCQQTISTIKKDTNMQSLWNKYCKKYSYAANIHYDHIIDSINYLVSKL